MRLIFLIYFLIVVIASCTPEGDINYNTYNNYYPEDTLPPPDTTEPFSVQIHYPARNELVEIVYDWIPAPNPNYNCPWGFQCDTTIYVEVTTDIPGIIAEARVFRRFDAYGDFDDYAVVNFPASNSFRIPVAHFNSGFSSYMTDDFNIAFWVSVMTEDSANYASPTILFRTVPRVNFEMAAPPLAPLLDSLYESSYQQRMDIEWCRQSPNVDSCRLAVRADVSGATSYLTFPGTYSGISHRGYLPITAYSVWLVAKNRYGESPASDTLHLTTGEPVPVDNFAAISYADGRVVLSWSNNSYPDSLLVSRRSATDPWTTVKTFGCENNYCPNSFADSTAVSGMLAYYRIGLQYENGIWWSPDSVGAWIP